MKLQINCMQCLVEQGHPSFDFQTVEIRDDGLYKITCDKGHTTLTVIQQQKFEILFDIGAMALLDGYPRESITSIAAALERFYEFYATVICLKCNIEFPHFKNTWKHVAAQSERQFGAYLFLYLIDHPNEIVPIIDNAKPNIEGRSQNNTMTWKEFRNTVVHKGYIPSKIETLAYGNIVYQHLYELIRDLKTRCPENIQQAIFHHIVRANTVANGSRISTMHISTLISLSKGDKAPVTFEEALEKLYIRKHFLY